MPPGPSAFGISRRLTRRLRRWTAAAVRAGSWRLGRLMRAGSVEMIDCQPASDHVVASGFVAPRPMTPMWRTAPRPGAPSPTDPRPRSPSTLVLSKCTPHAANSGARLDLRSTPMAANGLPGSTPSMSPSALGSRNSKTCPPLSAYWSMANSAGGAGFSGALSPARRPPARSLSACYPAGAP